MASVPKQLSWKCDGIKGDKLNIVTLYKYLVQVEKKLNSFEPFYMPQTERIMETPEAGRRAVSTGFLLSKSKSFHQVFIKLGEYVGVHNVSTKFYN